METFSVLSDFNGDVFTRLFNAQSQELNLQAESTGLGPVIPRLLDDMLPVWERSKSAFIWTRPESISQFFLQAKSLEPIDASNVLKDVDVFCDAVLHRARKISVCIVATWHLPADERGYGILDLRQNLGLRALLMQMNLRLIERLSTANGIFLLDTARWFETKSPMSDKLWYMTKVPYSVDVFKAALSDVHTALLTLRGNARKLLVCDLDDTLWGGIVGDAGWENLRLGGHDPLGEAFVDFQHQIKALSRRGIALAIASKNTENVALEAIDKHPEMVLKRTDFASWRINWEDKAKNIASIAQELNLGLQSIAFFDDNPVERQRVRDTLPEVFVPDLPDDKMLYPSFLRQVTCFDSSSISDEDRSRSQFYQIERQRQNALAPAQTLGSLEEWLKDLQIRVIASPLSAENLARTAQLLNKTNQMNARTRRLSEQELLTWNQPETRQVWTYRVTDKFGDNGLTGIASFEIDKNDAVITDFVLSCRVMGRKVEETILHHIGVRATRLGANSLVLQHIPTAKNEPSLNLLRKSGFTEYPEMTFRWELSAPYPCPNTTSLDE